jgi:hypothetical protein
MKFEIGDTVEVVRDGVKHTSTLKKKEGIFWRLAVNHPKDCCNYWSEDMLKLVKKR